MQKCAVLLMLAVGVGISVAGVAKEDLAEFARHTKQVVEGKFPDRECKTSADGATLVCGNVHLGLENLRRKIEEVGAEGATADAIILQYFGLGLSAVTQREHKATESGATATPGWETARELLRPQLVPADYRQQFADLVTREFLPGIDVAWAVGEPDHYALVLNSDLKDWGIPRQQLEQQALANLAAASRNVAIEGETSSDSELPGLWLAI